MDLGSSAKTVYLPARRDTDANILQGNERRTRIFGRGDFQVTAQRDGACVIERDFVILPSRKLLLCTVPKAANLTIKAMAEAVNARPRFDNMVAREKARGLSGDPAWWAVGFVRNPWDRLVSCWYNKLVETDYEGFARRFGWRRGEISFETFVEEVVQVPDAKADKHFRAQHRFHHGIAKQTIKVEDFATAWPPLAARFDLPPLAHKNKTAGRPEDYRVMYSENLAQQVASYYQLDIELYGYQF